MSIRKYIDIVEANSKGRNHAAAVSLHRLLTKAGAEFDGKMFQLEDAEKLGLRTDFERAKAADYIVFTANPDWWEPTKRGLIAIKTID